MKNKYRLLDFSFSIIRKPLYLFVKNKFKIKTIHLPQELKNSKEPYLLLGNHVTNYDPLISLAVLPTYVHYVASKTLLRNSTLNKLFKFGKVIPKSKFNSDVRTIKSILRLLKEGRSIGIFPEGRRNWDSHTLPLSDTTAKLVKTAKVDVYAFKLEGFYTSNPRWSDNFRKLNTRITFKKILSKDDLKTKTVEEINEIINHELIINEMKYLENITSISGNNFAENIERVLYFCPECGGFETLTSNRNNFSCSSCRTTFTVNERNEIIFNDSVYQLHDLITNYDRMLKNYNEHNNSYEFGSVEVEFGDNYYSFNKEVFNFMITDDNIILENKNHYIKSSVAEISNPNVPGNNKIEFNIEETCYIIFTETSDKFHSAKMTMDLLNIIKNKGRKKI